MCWCTPSVRTPNCGKSSCGPPFEASKTTGATVGHTGPAPRRDDSDFVGDLQHLLDRVAILEETVGLLLGVSREDTLDEVERATLAFRDSIEAKRRTRKAGQAW